MRQPKIRLTALSVERHSIPGRYADGNGLYLQVSESGGKSWIFRYSSGGKNHLMGIGPVKYRSLANARVKAMEYQKVLLDGGDPLSKKRAKQVELQIEKTRTITFDDCAISYVDANAEKWSNDKHVDQWRNTLKAYASPVIGHLPIRDIDTALVLKTLEPVWRKKTETASRLRGRMERILDWAAVRGYRTGDNPARWQGHLENILPAKSQIRKTRHQPALPVEDLPEFMAKLRKLGGLTPRCLEFLILTASRTGEAIGAKWDEFDLEGQTWIVPATRMKARKQHRVALSPSAVEIVKGLRELSNGSPYVFPGRRGGRPISNMTLLQLLKRQMGLKVVSHGFRSTFRDWASEHTNFSGEVVEMALAHTIRSKVERAYRRGDLFLKRIRLMGKWADYCRSQPIESTVIDLSSRAALGKS